VTKDGISLGIGGGGSVAITAVTASANSPVHVGNSGKVEALGPYGTGIAAISFGPSSPITIENSGSVYGTGVGIFSGSLGSSSSTTIVNTGDISAKLNLAVGVQGGSAKILNAGTITGYVLLDADDQFINQAGGTFEARQTSGFDAYGYATGTKDLFVNQSGGTVHTAANANVHETARFIHLEQFRNQGTISLQDGGTGDTFRISNTPGGTDLNFVASGNSTLAVDAFLGGAGSTADHFIVDGNVSGRTAVTVYDTNPGPGVLNTRGIPVVFVNGATPNSNAFYLKQPADAGFFDYDLFFKPTGSGFWSLKSFVGGGALALPQLIAAAQDIWRESTDTWFDRAADLRVLLNGGGAAPPTAPPNGGYGSAPQGVSIAPAVWVARLRQLAQP
jgi:Autochaperone Domain Type 1